MTENLIHAYCAACGRSVPADARFCPACGSAVGNLAAPVGGDAPPDAVRTAGSSRTSSRNRAAPLLVFALLTASGLAAAYAVFSDTEQQRAVPGSPTAAPPAQAAGAGAPGMPPDHPPVELPAEVVAFLDGLAKAAEATPSDAEAWRKLARARYRAGMLDPDHYEGADAAVDHVLELAPQDTEALRMKANIAYDLRRFADAEREFRRYLQVDPKDPGVRTDLASAVLFQGRIEEAREMYEDVIETNPEFVQAHVNLGITLHGEGKREEGLAALERARELATDPTQRERVESIIAAAKGAAPSQPGAGASVGEDGAGRPAMAGGAAAAGARAQAGAAGEPGMPAAVGPGGASGAPDSAGAAAVTSNAASGFQKGVDRLFASHSIVAPKVARIDWTGDGTAAVHLAAFPMDKMPPVMRNKFKSTMNEKIAALAAEHAVEHPRIDLVSRESGQVMDSLDAKEFVGAFDPQE